MIFECIGGPLDGQSLDVAGPDFRIPLPQRVTISDPQSLGAPCFRIGTYRVDRIKQHLVWDGEPGKDLITRPCDENEKGDPYERGSLGLPPLEDLLEPPEPWAGEPPRG